MKYAWPAIFYVRDAILFWASLMAEAPDPDDEEHGRKSHQHGRRQQDADLPLAAQEDIKHPLHCPGRRQHLGGGLDERREGSIGYQQPPSSAITIPSIMLNPPACASVLTRVPRSLPSAAAASAEVSSMTARAVRTHPGNDPAGNQGSASNFAGGSVLYLQTDYSPDKRGTYP